MRDGSGCPACPAFDACTAPYRSSRCAVLRYKYSLGDPKTHFDEIKAMSVEEMAEYIDKHFTEAMWCNSPPDDCPPHGKCMTCLLDWLRSPVEAD